jgi:hypothetical protein
MAGGAAAQTSGPDLIVGHVWECQVLGRVGTPGSGTVGMSCNTTACTIGDMGTNWYGLPSVDHPMIAVNMYRLWRRDGSDRLEQVGHGWIKHGFGTALADECGLGCTGGHFNENGPGCSDTYNACQFTPCDLGPRSMIHPYTGVMPSGPDLGPSPGCGQPCGRELLSRPSNDHRDHVHDPISHRVQVQDADLFPSLNVGARYITEGHYIVPHEYVDGNGTQNNNASYRNVLVLGPDACDQLIFQDQGATFAQQPAIDAWPGASQSLIEPAPLVDGRAFLVYKVTNLGNVWRYEYALYNMNMDRAMGSLSIPLPAGVVVSNIGFHAPLNHAPEPHTENYDNDPWTVSTSGAAITWSTDAFGADPFANAVRWGTVYNFYFDANTAPGPANATVGLFKTGGTVLLASIGPSAGPPDCNNNSIPDPTDVANCAGDPACADCNGNSVPDGCEPDCNGNDIADRCDIVSSFSTDCDGDAVPDDCEPFLDCNGNSARDDCETYADPSLDEDNDGIPDACGQQVTPRVWFVDDNAPNDPFPGSTFGSDPWENGSLARPFDAIAEAVAVAQSEDTVVVRDGLYTGPGNTFIDVFGKSITIRSERGPDNCTVDLEGSNFFMSFSGGAAGSRLEGFQILNPWRGPGAPQAIFVDTSATIANCRFAAPPPNGNTKAIWIGGGSRVVISHCTFDQVQFPVESVSGECVLENCVISGANIGMDVEGGNGTPTCIGASLLRVVNSTITASSTGIRTSGGTVGSIENSIVWGNTNFQLVGLTGAVSVSYSDIQGGYAGTGNIDLDPLFVNAGALDYRLSAGSPCIDAGNSAAADLPANDLEGGAREFDKATTPDTGVGGPPVVDMGADEWNDCNANGIDDSTDVNQGAPDCDGDSIPDSCESVVDCNTNTIDDRCDIASGGSGDCNVNGVPDECDTDTGLGGTSEDCDGNDVPDECQADCQPNGLADECDIAGPSDDCTGNSIPDECEPDCQPNGMADSCEAAACGGAPGCADCNGNAALDECDIAAGSSTDVNGNGVPDECDPVPPEPMTPAKARSLSVTVPPGATAGPAPAALRVTMLDLQNPVPPNAPCCQPPSYAGFEAGSCEDPAGCVRWVGPAVRFLESQDSPGSGSYTAARLQCAPYYRDWTSLGGFHIIGAEIIPSSTYRLESLASACAGSEVSCPFVSLPVIMQTARAGDIATPYQTPTPPLTQPNALDVTAAVNKFRNLVGAPPKAVAQVQPNVLDPNSDLSALDVVAVVDTARGFAYLFSGPCVCPSSVPCNATMCSGAGNCTGLYGAGATCTKTCSSGPRLGLPCNNTLNCGSCSAASAIPGLPCDADSDCAGGACDEGTCAATGFCRDRCGRCN